MRLLIFSFLFLSSAGAAVADPARVLSLSEVNTLVESRNRVLESARRTADAAEADQLTAAVTPPPQLSLNTQSIDPHNLGAGGVWNRHVDTILRLEKTIELGGKADLRVAGAEAGVRASRADLRDAARQQRLAAIGAYWDLKLAQRQYAVAEEGLRLARESSRLAKLREKAGDLPRIDAQKLAVEAERANNDLASARLQVSQARANLAAVLALETEASTLAAGDPWPAADVALPAQPDTDARSDVIAARARVEQARQALQLARAQRTADVTVGVQYEHYPPDGNQLWGVGISMPIGVSGRQEGAVRHAALALNEAQAQLEQSRARARSDWEQAREAALVAAERATRHEHELIPQARAVLEAAQFARARGALALQDLIDAQRTLHAAELDAEQAHADHAKALAALAAATETDPLSPPSEKNP